MKKELPTKPVSGGVIDTSKMSSGERAALELAEASREKASGRRTFAGSLFMGRPDFSPIAPFPVQSLEDEDQGDAFILRLEAFLREQVDADEIDRTGEIPDAVFRGLADLGAFGIKIPTRYGGLGLSQTNYSRAAALLGSYCGNLTALLSAHQSIGVPQPLIVFGTEEQKQRFLPRCARGEISAFALTEPGVGSDPAKMKTTATPTLDCEDGSYLINGEKLWCTNGVKAGLLVVMAKTPGDKVTAFIVEADAPGVEVTHRCRFMGLRALYNGVIKFTNVHVPGENIILAEGKGLKVALTTLNTGRITLPAAAAGLGKQCLQWATDWSFKRVQWGQAIGKHDAIAQKLANIAADTFAIESMVHYVSALVDADKKADIRIEAAFAKLWGTERGWDIVNETMQIRGGRGYETAQSLAARGDDPVPIERFFRDSRINTIFEGSSEIMRLFIAREALDPHLNIGGPVLNTTLSKGERLRAMLKSMLFYGRWYPLLWLPAVFPAKGTSGWDPVLRRETRRVRGLSRKLARVLFHRMLRHGPKLDKKQVVLGRIVDIGAELFATTATVARAQALLEDGRVKDREQLLAMVEFFAKSSRGRIRNLFADLRGNADSEGYRVVRGLDQSTSNSA